MQVPEALARKNIDKLLTECGWIIQDYRQLDVSAGRGIAIREVPLKCGRSDYLLLVDREHLEADNVPGPIYKAFGYQLWPLMDELNLTLAA
jgi:hypothetical protein